jgi:serine protease Do
MTIPTMRSAAGWLTWLSLGWLTIAAVTAGAAAGQEEPAVLQSKFHHDFRTSDYPPEFLLPVGQGDMTRDGRGLQITYAPAKGLRQATGLYTMFALRGDFEVTVSFEILKADRPQTGEGVDPILYASKQRGGGAVSLGRLLLPDGKTVFMSDHLLSVQGQWTHQRKSIATTATAGKLRLERQGTKIRFRANEAGQSEFVTVAEVEFGRADLYFVQLGGSLDGSEGGLDMRLLDFSVRAESLPGQRAEEASTQRLDATQLTGLEDKLQKLYVQLAPSVVRIHNPSSDETLAKAKASGFSGVIVSPSGEILTCAHHSLAPKTKVMVELADGRMVQATVAGKVKQKLSAPSRYVAADVGMIVLDDKRDWPYAKLGLAATGKDGDICLALGYPNVYRPGQAPLFRLGRLLARNPLGMIRSCCRILPGDSGGPLFDFQGRVLGVASEMENLKEGVNLHSPVEYFLELRDRLRAGEEAEFEKVLPEKIERRRDLFGAWQPTAELSKTLSAAHQSVVEVLGDGKVVALGMIVDKAGWVLTKRTELTGPAGPRRLVCRMANGAQLDARLLGESRAHDLALLQVPGKGLPAVRWGKSDGLGVGQLIASLGPGQQPLHYGAVGALAVKNPGVKGYLPINTKAAPKDLDGMIFTNFMPSHLQVEEACGLLKAGDLITHLDDVPTPSADEFLRVRDKRLAAPGVIVGEWIKLTVQRAGKTNQVFVPLVDEPTLFPTVWQQARWNLRRNGFPQVFCHDGGIAWNRCGGPVVDRSGQVIGINIARVNAIQTFAIPSDAVQTVIAQLKRQAYQ